MAATENRTYATGRRKEASARVWIAQGTGKITVNGREADDYFGREATRLILRQPLQLLELGDKIDAWANVEGGGLSGQAGAVRHGLARALAALGDDYRGPLKKAGMLTRDPRVVERKKYGRPGARKRFQYSKR